MRTLIIVINILFVSHQIQPMGLQSVICFMFLYSQYEMPDNQNISYSHSTIDQKIILNFLALVHSSSE